MTDGVTSGRGRNGPWLQNRWLRVETRQDDGSISPVALAGAFRPVERGLAWAQPLQGEPLRFERAAYDINPYADALGAGRRLVLTARVPGATLRRETVLYDAHPFCVTRAGITNDTATALPLTSLHVFTTPSSGRGRLLLASRPADWRIYRHGWQSWAPTMSLGGAQSDLQSRTPELAPEAPGAAPGRFASDDVGVLHDPASGRSLLVGAISARDFLSQTCIDAPARSIDARCLTDGIAVPPGETIWSERIVIDLCGTPNEQLERYGDALGREMGARVPPTPPSGWCSWYYFFTQVTEEDVLRNLRFLEEHRRDLPIDTVQIDDGYQADIGDWLAVNEKFPHGMEWLARQIKSAGYTPGIWTAPFLLAESSQTYRAHPNWVVHDGAGAPVVACENWQRRSYGLDGSHPEARAWLAGLFREICDGWGYDYIKIDFLYAAAIAGRRYDAATTRVRAYRAALDAVRDGAGDDRFILGCGSLMAPSVGVFDGNRIGPDVAPFWRFLTAEERMAPRPRFRRPDDPLSAETAVRNTLTRSWMHGRLWANDPDCVLVRADRTKLTLDEVRTLASVIGLSGGMMLSSDDLPLVPPERVELLSMLLPPLPRSARPLDIMERDLPESFESVFDRDVDPLRVVGLFNFDDDAKDLAHPLPPGRWHAFELWGERYLGAIEGEITFALVEAHGCRVVSLRPVKDAPSVVGTNAHIGIGALDVAAAAFDEGSATLRLSLAPAGRRRRTVWIAGGGRRAVAARLAGAGVTLKPAGPDAWRIDLILDAEAALEVTFGHKT